MKLHEIMTREIDKLTFEELLVLLDKGIFNLVQLDESNDEDDDDDDYEEHLDLF